MKMTESEMKRFVGEESWNMFKPLLKKICEPDLSETTVEDILEERPED